MKVGSTETNQLRVRVGEQAALQQRIVGKVDARHDVPGMEGNLLGFRKKIIGIAIERQLADTTEPERIPPE